MYLHVYVHVHVHIIACLNVTRSAYYANYVNTCIFSANLASFMESKGYTFEANFIQIILNSRRTCDERGLSEQQRSHYNYKMLNFLLDDLMPWHHEIYDFSTLEVNRCVNMHSNVGHVHLGRESSRGTRAL